MLKKLIDIIAAKEDLIDLSKNNALLMIKTSKEMFDLVLKSFEDKVDHTIKDSVARIDKKINKMQKEVRKMVFEHIAVSGPNDLVESFQLFSIVHDIERIGDYAKNLADVLDYLPEEDINLGEYKSRFDSIVTETRQMFDKTIIAICDFDINEASEVTIMYRRLSDLCERTISDIIKVKGNSVKKSEVRLLLLVRYIKRINAHLKNAASTIKDPIQSIQIDK